MTSGQEQPPARHATGDVMMGWMRDLFPINRSLTGEGVRRTLDYLGGLMPGLTTHEVPSGTQAFDWKVPDEWTIRQAYVEDEEGRRIIDFARHNLHVVGYSVPVDEWMDLEALDAHLHSLPSQPQVIPYVTSYYSRRWGFCLSHDQRRSLKPGRYRAVIDADLAPGSLTYADLVLPGESDREILFSTYVCHPSMANNELSGPVVAAALAQAIAARPRRRLTYRFVFVPETIGSLVYLSRHLPHLKARLAAGFVLTCVGDERAYSYIASREGDCLADRVARHVLSHAAPDFIAYDYLQRGSDERQYCAPGIDLPVASIARSKYAVYPEYHTSADDLTLVTPEGLSGSLSVYLKCIELLEHNDRYRVTVLGEPQLGRRGLYPNLSTPESAKLGRDLLNVIAYCDGRRDLIELADRIRLPAGRVIDILRPLLEHGLVERLSDHADGPSPFSPGKAHG